MFKKILIYNEWYMYLVKHTDFVYQRVNLENNKYKCFRYFYSSHFGTCVIHPHKKRAYTKRSRQVALRPLVCVICIIIFF